MLLLGRVIHTLKLLMGGLRTIGLRTVETMVYSVGRYITRETTDIYISH